MRRFLAVVFILLLISHSLFGAATFDASANGSTSAAGTSIPNFTLTIGGGVTNGAVGVGITFSSNAVSAISVTICGSAGSLVSGSDTGSTQTYRTAIYTRATGSTTGSCTISISWTGSSSAAAGALSVSGASQSTPMNNGTFTTTSQGGAAGTASVTVTSTNGDLTMDWVSNESGTVCTSPTQTSRFSFQGNDFQTGNTGSTGPGTGTTTHTWTAQAFQTTENSGANFKAAAGATGNPAQFPRIE